MPRHVEANYARQIIARQTVPRQKLSSAEANYSVFRRSDPSGKQCAQLRSTMGFCHFSGLFRFTIQLDAVPKDQFQTFYKASQKCWVFSAENVQKIYKTVCNYRAGWLPSNQQQAKHTTRSGVLLSHSALFQPRKLGRRTFQCCIVYNIFCTFRIIKWENGVILRTRQNVWRQKE